MEEGGLGEGRKSGGGVTGDEAENQADIRPRGAWKAWLRSWGAFWQAKGSREVT